MNILFTCAGRRNYLIEYFKQALQGKGVVVAADMQLSAPAMAVADKAYLVPEVYADNYIELIKEICKKEKIKAIISLNDLELPILAESKAVFESIGVNVLVSDSEVIDVCFDKVKSMDFAASIGLNTPKTYLSLSEAEMAFDKGDLSFPLVVKPRWGSASIGIEFPKDFNELELAYKLLTSKLKHSILAIASSNDFEHAILIQQKIKGKEYGLDVLNDFYGVNHSVYVKEKLAMRAGETDKARLVNLPVVEDIGKLVGQKLKHIGNLDCDVMEMDGNYYFIEMNPRFGGGYPFTYMAGGNFPAVLIDWLLGNKLNMEHLKKNYGATFSKCDQLIKIKE
ncbi:MAG: ATP-grasp domain-containing protein [Bacteroidales bacterium]